MLVFQLKLYSEDQLFQHFPLPLSLIGLKQNKRHYFLMQTHQGAILIYTTDFMHLPYKGCKIYPGSRKDYLSIEVLSCFFLVEAHAIGGCPPIENDEGVLLGP